ncbi:hypothetical protein [Halomonas caseinilytica]|uniref:hypothetical protein n=1 Tax=Halomonas caseinilytica TaxID=438744 RepID=UPI00147F6AD0|nr:hypothetical protein [Halomonas caseinilytica]
MFSFIEEVGEGLGSIAEGVGNIAQGVGNIAQGVGNIVGETLDIVDNAVEEAGALMGNSLITAGEVLHIAQHSPLANQISDSIGSAPVAVKLHYLTDEALGLAYKDINTFGEILGGTVSVPSHAEEEWENESIFSVESSPDWFVDFLNPVKFVADTVGNTLSTIAYQGDALQDSGLFKQIGDIADSIGLSPIHQTVDAGLDLFYDVLNEGAQLAGVNPANTDHYETSWA